MALQSQSTDGHIHTSIRLFSGHVEMLESTARILSMTRNRLITYILGLWVSKPMVDYEADMLVPRRLVSLVLPMSLYKRVKRIALLKSISFSTAVRSAVSVYLPTISYGVLPPTPPRRVKLL